MKILNNGKFYFVIVKIFIFLSFRTLKSNNCTDFSRLRHAFLRGLNAIHQG